jgi:hypothetical protein
VAVGIRITLHGIDAETFDRAHDSINPDRSVPQGMIFHASGPVDGGWGVVDVWESRAAFDAFAGQIQAGMEAAGVEPSGPPAIEEFPVHEYIV